MVGRYQRVTKLFGQCQCKPTGGEVGSNRGDVGVRDRGDRETLDALPQAPSLFPLPPPSLYPSENILFDQRYLENAFVYFSEVVFVNSEMVCLHLDAT